MGLGVRGSGALSNINPRYRGVAKRVGRYSSIGCEAEPFRINSAIISADKVLLNLVLLAREQEPIRYTNVVEINH